jgi:hypothetical protein
LDGGSYDMVDDSLQDKGIGLAWLREHPPVDHTIRTAIDASIRCSFEAGRSPMTRPTRIQ